MSTISMKDVKIRWRRMSTKSNEFLLTRMEMGVNKEQGNVSTQDKKRNVNGKQETIPIQYKS